MPINKTEAFKEAIAFAEPDTVFIETVKIDHELLAEPFYLVNSDTDFSYDGNTYTRTQFEITLPEMSVNTGGGLSLNMSDISQDVSSDLDLVNDSVEPITILWQTFIVGESGPQANFEAALEVKAINLQNRALSVTAAYPDTVNKQIPSNKYATTDYPGLA